MTEDFLKQTRLADFIEKEKEFASFLQTNVEGLGAERANMVAPLLIQGGFETKEDLRFADFETLRLCKILPAQIAMILTWAKGQQEMPSTGKRKAEDMDQNAARENKRASRSLESYFGTHTVVMKAPDLLKYIQGCQDQKKMRENDVIHNEAELSLKLQGRKKAMETTMEAFRTRKDSFASGADDRTLYPMVVYSGMAGLGKTRMLEEWKTAFKRLDIAANTYGVLITYGNGHSAQDFEDNMSIEASFGWRLLHRIFVEGNAATEEVEHWHNTGFLPLNADKLSLDLALKVVIAGAKEMLGFSDENHASLFVGVDEFQKIPKGPDYNEQGKDRKRERDKTLLWKLLNSLNEKRVGLHLYPALAGTQLGPLDIGSSSVVQTVRAPMTLLDTQMIEEVVRSSSKAGCLKDPEMRRNLFFLGGIPRPSVKFVLESPNDFESVWEQYIVNKWFVNEDTALNNEELLRLIAYAVSGIEVAIASKTGIQDLKWGALVDKGLCMVSKNGKVDIPYSVFRLAATRLNDYMFQDYPNKCLLQNLKYLHDHVDKSLFVIEPWQAWESFGACYFSMRVNSLKLLGIDKVKMEDLFKGAVVKGCQDFVNLSPMEVHKIEESLSRDLQATVTETLHHRELNWLDGGDAGIRYCLINGTGGQGVDFFTTLRMSNESEGGLMLYNDQRKMVASNFGSRKARDLLSDADIVPRCLPSSSKCVRGIFSALASFKESSDRIPENCVVLSHEQSKSFHCALSVHPACKAFVDVNFDNLSTLKLLNSVKKLASLIIRRREKRFADVEEFCQFCETEGYKISQKDRLRVVTAPE